MLSFTRVRTEPGAAGYMYALRTRGILHVTQSIPRLAREVLYQVYNSTVNISSLYRSVNKENKRRRAYSLVSISLQELNDLVREHRHEAPQAIVDRIVEDYTRFRQADSDDITLLVLRRRGK